MDYRLISKIEIGLKEVIGKPVKQNDIVIGEVIKYNPENGECTFHIFEKGLFELNLINKVGKK